MTPAVIGLGGKLRAGKDAVADHLVEAHGFVKMGMSDALLEHSLILDPFIPINAHESPIIPGAMEGTFVPASVLVDTVGYVEAKKNPEYRRFLQQDGTEGGRDFHHENIWVDRVGRTMNEHLLAGRSVVLTGLRFLNELAIVRSFGGRCLWVDRPGLDSDAPVAAHASENTVHGGLFDTTITNDGTLEQLYATVDRLLERTHAP